ncbi:hypothetical protein S231_03410 [Candidatus Phytoplasma solani]|nr:hypothetical protein S231_03410 [Candidatus Phytoplasma solani]
MFNFGITKLIFTLSFIFIIIFFLNNIIRQYRSGEPFTFKSLFSFKGKTPIIITVIVFLLLLIGTACYFFLDKNNPQFAEQLFHDVDPALKNVEKFLTKGEKMLSGYDQMISQLEQQKKNLENAITRDKQKKKQIKEKIKKIEEALTKLRLEKNNLIAQKHEKESKLKTLEITRNEIVNEMDTLQKKYSAATTPELRDKLFLQIQEKQNVLTPIQREIIQLEGEINALNIQIEDKENEIETKEREMFKLQREYNRIKIKIQHNEAKKKDVEQIIAEIEAEKKELKEFIEEIKRQKAYLQSIKELMGNSLAEYDNYRTKNEFNAGFFLKCIAQIGNIVTDVIPQTKLAKETGNVVNTMIQGGAEIAQEKYLKKTDLRDSVLKFFDRTRNQVFAGRVLKRGFKMFQTHQLLFDKNGCIKMLSKESYDRIITQIRKDEERIEEELDKYQKRYDGFRDRINNNEDIKNANNELLNKGAKNPKLASDLAQEKANLTNNRLELNNLQTTKSFKEFELINKRFCANHFQKQIDELTILYNQLDNPNVDKQQITGKIIESEKRLQKDMQKYIAEKLKS